VLRGVQLPRIEVTPGGGTGPGDEVADLAHASGLTLDPWQRHTLRAALAETGDLFSALEVALLVPRQNGKSATLAALAVGAATILDGNLVIVSAHEHKTALEIHSLACRLVQDGPLRSVWKRNRRSGAETSIEFRNGARILFMARTGGSGRGFSSDVVILDEAYSLRRHQIAALLPTLSARPNPLIVYASSAPMHDSEQLHHVRRRALGDHPGRLTYLEWSCEAGVRLDDREAWAQANPGLGYRLTERFIETELDAMPAREFERERLGIGDDPDGVSVVDMARWMSLIDGDSEIPRPLGFGLDVTPERDAGAIAVSGVRLDGLAHVEVVEHIPGTEWIVPRVADLWERHGVPVWIELSSPAAAFTGPLEARGVAVKTQARGAGAAALFSDAITAGSLHHLGQGSLTAALTGARRKTTGDTWYWSRASSSTDISPLVAVSLAHYGAMIEPPPPPKRKMWAY
jgi:hypothetical protein